MQETEAVTEVTPSPQHVTEINTFKAANPFPATFLVPIKSEFQGLAQHFDISITPCLGGTHSHSTERTGIAGIVA